MTLTSLIAAHLQSSVTGLAFVGDAADLDSIKREAMKFPSAFVVPVSEAGGPNDLQTGGVEQRREPRVGVVLAVRNVRAARGSKALTDIEALRDLVDAALLGWCPTGDHDPLLFRAGKLLSMNNGVLIWQDDYSTAFFRRAT